MIRRLLYAVLGRAGFLCDYCRRPTRFKGRVGGGWCPVLTFPCCRSCHTEQSSRA